MEKSNFKNCLWCDDKFQEKGIHYQLDGFCSEECYNAYKEIHVEIPLKIEKPNSKICVICGSLFSGKEDFCSGACSIKYCEEKGIWYQRVKIKLPPRYCKKFNPDLKERVRTYFNNKCVLCGKTELENEQALSVHHVNYDKKAGCDGKKLSFVALCKQCHNKVHSDKAHWQSHFETIIERDYNSKCYYTKEEYGSLKSQECKS